MNGNGDNILAWLKRQTWPSAGSSGKPVRVVDLFSGCGGLTLGAWEAARRSSRPVEVRLAIDFDQEAIEVYRRNFSVSETVARCDSIQKFFRGQLWTDFSPSELEIREFVGEVDVLLAGPPCQGHSDLNNRSRRNDPRNNLFTRAIRAIQLLQPGIAMIENVPGIVHDKGKVIQRGDKYLARMGYKIQHILVNTESLGLPQRRRRYVLVATRSDISHDFRLVESGKPVSLWPFISDLEHGPQQSKTIFNTPSRATNINQNRIKYLFDNDLFDLPNSERPRCHENGHSYKSMYGRLYKDRAAQTVTTGFGSMGQGRYVHPTQSRLITPHEAARIQGFPDFFRFDGVKKRGALQRMIGNAVPPVVAATLLESYCRECGTWESGATSQELQKLPKISRQSRFMTGSKKLILQSSTTR